MTDLAERQNMGRAIDEAEQEWKKSVTMKAPPVQDDEPEGMTPGMGTMFTPRNDYGSRTPSVRDDEGIKHDEFGNLRGTKDARTMTRRYANQSLGTNRGITGQAYQDNLRKGRETKDASVPAKVNNSADYAATLAAGRAAKAAG